MILNQPQVSLFSSQLFPQSLTPLQSHNEVMHVRRGESPPHFTDPVGQSTFAKQINMRAVNDKTLLGVNAALRDSLERTKFSTYIPASKIKLTDVTSNS